MSAMMVKAHGGSRSISSVEGGGSLVLGGILSKTTTGVPVDAHMKDLDRLISNTTGMMGGKPAMDGVIASTIPEHMRDVPELHKVSPREIGKTDSKMGVGVPYAGKKSGYGAASKKH